MIMGPGRMKNNMKTVKIISDGLPRNTHVIDEETGEELKYITKIELVLDAKEPVAEAVIHVFKPTTEITISNPTILTHCVHCGQEIKPVEP